MRWLFLCDFCYHKLRYIIGTGAFVILPLDNTVHNVYIIIYTVEIQTEIEMEIKI